MSLTKALLHSIFGYVQVLDPLTGAKNIPLNIFPLACGDCGGCILELLALKGAAFNLSSYGFSLVHHLESANALLVTGVLNRSMLPSLEQSWATMREPKAIIMLGACASNKGIFEKNYTILNKAINTHDCILNIEGCPPAPKDIVESIIKLLQNGSNPSGLR
ncbi:NAD(P)H-quinone oxidoreductase subunit K, chloroplastic [Commensalibacter sp. Nvir]|uniref:NADH-quinone oxidoreductase subunit B family protein n=1 Tax=Commensalibacter sp. Nvir TaxID=3069817 RepID=UPI002D4A97F1|nr:NAD(P)H-quinone oxidoreductase subunit K, chloroplastic [Commensalibacter sp. Nvir]